MNDKRPASATDSALTHLQQTKARLADAARPEIVEKIGSSGKLTARQRINALLDRDSLIEIGAIAAQTDTGDWVAEPGGVDYIGTIDGQAVVASSTDYTDHGGGYGAGRLGRLFAVALERRWPVVLFVDGGGSRALHPRAGLGHIETSGPIGRFSFLDGLPELSGWVPTIAVVSGPAFAGHASLAGMCDLLISTPGSSIGMGGPPMVEAALGQRMTPNELAGAEMHDTGGGIDLLVGDEHQAIDMVRQYLSFYHQRHSETSDPVVPDLDPGFNQHTIETIIDGLIDTDSALELRPNFARGVITALARIGGNAIGLIANRSSVNQGLIGEGEAVKLNRFIEQCNTQEYPLVALIDTPGCSSGGNPGLSRWHTRVLLAHQRRTTPLISIQVGAGAGLGPTLMTGASSTRGVVSMKLAWPQIRLGQRDGFSAVVDHNAFDDVITPNETRERLVRLLKLMPHAAPNGPKKHRIDSW